VRLIEHESRRAVDALGEEIEYRQAGEQPGGESGTPAKLLTALSLQPDIEREIEITRNEDGSFGGKEVLREFTEGFVRASGTINNSLFLDAEQATLEGMEAGLAAARPGNTCEDIANGFFAVLAKYGILKDNRTGYGIGLSYPPDWGERTMSLRPGDKTVLQPGMTFHFMTGLWLEDMGLEITESILITETGVECLADVPRKLFVKD